MVTMLSTFPCCPPRVGNNQAGPPALSVCKAFPEAITTLPSNVVREHGECPHSSFSFHVIYLHNILAQRQTEHTFKYTERVRLPASGHVGFFIRASTVDGGTPRISEYRFRYPRWRSQRTSIYLFCDTHLHIGSFQSVSHQKQPATGREPGPRQTVEIETTPNRNPDTGDCPTFWTYV